MLILLPPSAKKSASPGPAIQVYTGVLYAALGWDGLTNAQQRLGEKSIAIISAKYGVVRPLDPIEPYKENINNKKIAPQVAERLNAIETELIVDCRSATYQTVWRCPIEKTVEVKSYAIVNGEKKTITHMSKKIRGEVTRLLLQSGSTPSNPEQLKQVVSKFFSCDLIEATDKKPWVLEVHC